MSCLPHQPSLPPCLPPASLSYEARIPLAKNAMAKRCLELMVRKKTNLSVAADVDTAEEMLAIAEKVRYNSAAVRQCGRYVL